MKKEMLCAVMAGIAGVASADENVADADATVPAPIIVYASRIDDAKDEMPSAVCVLSADDIERSGARDLPELLKKKGLSDIHAMNGNPLLTSVAMRGFGDNAFGRMKVTLDGEELSNVDMNPPNLTRIPLGSASRVEIIRGPSPVLYGDGAIAGVIAVSTDSRDYEKRSKISAKAGSHGTFGANFLTRGGIEEDGIQYGASYDYLRSDGFRSRSAFDMHSASASAKRNFDNGSSVGLNVNYQNAFYELPGSLSREQWKHARRSAINRHDWARVWSYGINLDSKMKLADDQWLRLDGGFSHQYRHAKYASSASDLEYDVWCWHFSPRYVNESDIGEYGNKFTLGLDFRFDRYGEDHPFSLGAPVKRHFLRSRIAAFAHDEFFLTDELSLVAGVRVERIDNRWAHYRALAQSRSHDWMGDLELGFVFRPLDGLKTFAKATRFHRSAFCDELSYTQNGRFLDPETGYSLDIGAEWLFLDEFSFEIDGYGMIMDDEIFYDPAQQPFGYNRNSPAKTRRIGLDTGLTWCRDKVAEASVKYGVVHADFASGRYHGCDVPFVPNHRIRAEAGWWIFDDLEIKGGYSYTSSQRVSGDFANEYEKLAAFSLFDAAALYSPSWAKGWKAAFVIDNLFDRNYCDYAGVGYYYPATGRSFLFTLSYEF